MRPSRPWWPPLGVTPRRKRPRSTEGTGRSGRAVERHIVRKPCPRRTHTAAIPLADLTAVGVTTVAIPRTGKPSAARARIEPADDFVDTVKCRTGCEGRVSHLERDWAWRRTRLRGHAGARTWCAHDVFAARVATLTIRGLGAPLAVRLADHSSIAATHRWDDADDQAATIGVGDQIAIYELFALYGHLIDAGELDRLNGLFTHDFEYDGEALGLGSPQRPPWWKQLGQWV